jgi:hypothetical protein
MRQLFSILIFLTIIPFSGTKEASTENKMKLANSKTTTC